MSYFLKIYISIHGSLAWEPVTSKKLQGVSMLPPGCMVQNVTLSKFSQMYMLVGALTHSSIMVCHRETPLSVKLTPWAFPRESPLPVPSGTGTGACSSYPLCKIAPWCPCTSKYYSFYQMHYVFIRIREFVVQLFLVPWLKVWRSPDWKSGNI